MPRIILGDLLGGCVSVPKLPLIISTSISSGSFGHIYSESSEYARYIRLREQLADNLARFLGWSVISGDNRQRWFDQRGDAVKLVLRSGLTAELCRYPENMLASNKGMVCFDPVGNNGHFEAIRHLLVNGRIDLPRVDAVEVYATRNEWESPSYLKCIAVLSQIKDLSGLLLPQDIQQIMDKINKDNSGVIA